MLIIGLADKRIQERLLRESELTLTKVVSTCQTTEITRKQAKSMQKGHTQHVNTVRKQQTDKFDKDREKNLIQNCKYCSYTHNRGSCPAYGKVCNVCQKKNHFSMCCSKRNKTEIQI